MRARIGDWLDERIGHREVLAQWQRPVAGGASFAHTLSFLVAFLLVIEAASGALLALYYAPSTGAAWASVAYIEDQVTMGSVVRGVHRWGMSAVVIVAGLHLVVTALRGGYRRPRELQWWLGLGLIGVITLYSVTGFVLRWDQYGYWATKVELAYVNDAPGPGRQLVQAVQGGNEFGNLTLTHFYALHAVVLPIVTLLLAWALRAQARRHGVLPTGGPARAAWPYQSLRNWVVAALALIALVAWSEHAGGAGLDGPADPTAAYDARPQWYFRPLFALVNTFGSLRTFMALGLPLVVFGVLAAVPLFDGRPGRPRRHYAVLAMLFVGLVGAIGVSMQSYAKDDDDQELQRRSHRFAREAARARALAKTNGVPSPGGLAVFTTPRFYVARTLWASECASCHDGDDRKAPVIGPGLASRAHIRSLLLDPSAPEHFGTGRRRSSTTRTRCPRPRPPAPTSTRWSSCSTPRPAPPTSTPPRSSRASRCSTTARAPTATTAPAPTPRPGPTSPATDRAATTRRCCATAGRPTCSASSTTCRPTTTTSSPTRSVRWPTTWCGCAPRPRLISRP